MWTGELNEGAVAQLPYFPALDRPQGHVSLTASLAYSPLTLNSPFR